MKFKVILTMRKRGDLSDFERGVVVGAIKAGISKTADLLGFSDTTIFKVYRECSKKKRYLIYISSKFSVAAQHNFLCRL